MKKIRNLVIGGLEQKIFNLVLFSIILIVLAFMGVAVYQTRSLSSLFQKTSEEQKTAVTDSTTAIMEGVIDATMTREASLEAYIADSMFREFRPMLRIRRSRASPACSLSQRREWIRRIRRSRAK